MLLVQCFGVKYGFIVFCVSLPVAKAYLYCMMTFDFVGQRKIYTLFARCPINPTLHKSDKGKNRNRYHKSDVP